MNKDIELRKISQLIDRIGAAMSTVKGNTFSSTDIEQDLTRLLSGESKAGLLPFAEHKVAMSAAAALIKYLKVGSSSRCLFLCRLTTATVDAR